ncbi:hypothetical protein [Aquibacillus rhizosphaerae]|uniref:DUF4901 domain-containing protein n=1 Tax=Aquibacillus rhizosphaerae TaxID=3051431 RepID=A0ABT7L7B4_9BACI|nr:hypothetical protein [Aquibacillus sp. LR5S19]MDL4841743.1 hypothetical protein [Aquibacillus sp. LR5S19]
MDQRIAELIHVTKTKFGLDDYYLERHRFYRNVNIFNETVYTLCMEWFPKHVTEEEDEDSNPDGAAVIDINVDTGKYESVIFVMGETYAKDGISFATLKTDDIIKWVENETGLTHGKQFQLHKEEEGELFFKECIDGIAVSPSGSIQLEFNKEGNLTLFAVHGQFPSREVVKEEVYTLSLEKIEDWTLDQVKLAEFPSFEENKLTPVYAMEEIYVTNDQMLTIPFTAIVDERSHLKIDKTMVWNQPIDQPFESKEISWVDDVTAIQAFSSDPSPDSFPITKEEQDQCVITVRDFLRQEYPNDTGEWVLKTLHRDKGYIHATMKANHQSNLVFQRKLSIMIDGENLKAVNYIDTKSMLEMFDEFQVTDQIKITREEAVEKLRPLFELKPYYVYDFQQGKYILCGKLDCHYGVNAGSGEVIPLDDL